MPLLLCFFFFFLSIVPPSSLGGDCSDVGFIYGWHLNFCYCSILNYASHWSEVVYLFQFYDNELHHAFGSSCNDFCDDHSLNLDASTRHKLGVVQFVFILGWGLRGGTANLALGLLNFASVPNNVSWSIVYVQTLGVPLKAACPHFFPFTHTMMLTASLLDLSISAFPC